MKVTGSSRTTRFRNSQVRNSDSRHCEKNQISDIEVGTNLCVPHSSEVKRN
jgi:hypothetical protein